MSGASSFGFFQSHVFGVVPCVIDHSSVQGAEVLLPFGLAPACRFASSLLALPNWSQVGREAQVRLFVLSDKGVLATGAMTDGGIVHERELLEVGGRRAVFLDAWARHVELVGQFVVADTLDLLN